MFVSRRDDGAIYGMWTVRQHAGQEELPEDHPDVVAFRAAQAAREAAGETKARLREIDAASIRAIREWVAAQPDAPQFLKDREAEAVAEREKLK